jgi:hypothetical protein
LMLMTFTCECAWSLRTFAVAANLAFIAYGWMSGLAPVLVLHLVLLPINVVRLVGALRASAAASVPVPVPGHLGLQRLDQTARCEPLKKSAPGSSTDRARRSCRMPDFRLSCSRTQEKKS